MGVGGMARENRRPRGGTCVHTIIIAATLSGYSGQSICPYARPFGGVEDPEFLVNADVPEQRCTMIEKS
jgi:hypothetical protein